MYRSSFSCTNFIISNFDTCLYCSSSMTRSNLFAMRELRKRFYPWGQWLDFHRHALWGSSASMVANQSSLCQLCRTLAALLLLICNVQLLLIDSAQSHLCPKFIPSHSLRFATWFSWLRTLRLWSAKCEWKCPCDTYRLNKKGFLRKRHWRFLIWKEDFTFIIYWICLHPSLHSAQL